MVSLLHNMILFQKKQKTVISYVSLLNKKKILPASSVFFQKLASESNNYF